MVKRIGRRFVSLLLTFVTILTLLPAMTLPALAATSGTVTGLADENIGLSFTGDADNAWSANGTSIIGAATSTGGTCSDTSYKSTLTITNKRSTTATLSFDYSIEQNSGKIQVDGTEVSSGASFTKELTANESVKVSIESGSTSAATKITLTNVVLVSNVNATATFVPAENGTYTVDGKLITEEYSNTQSSMTAYQVVATQADGYQFLGWYNVTEKKYINTSPKAALNIESNCTITARFASKTAALFETKGQRFDNLNDAITEAQKNLPATIALVSDGPLAGTYTIPNEVTLLIPFDEAKTCYTATPSATTSQADAKVFRTLTMKAGSSITLASGAAISVGGQYYAASGGRSGKMVGPYGCIRMESGSAITVKSGASLYAWGFISGSGSVTVKDGGSVCEWYQILDFRGGSATLKMGNKVFPFNQYAVQNIEVPLTVYAGASETAYTAVDASGGIKPTSVPFIGNNGLFKLVSGSLTKAYDGETDRIHYTINGVAELNSLNLKLAGISVDSSSYVLPLTNNMTINLTTGSKLTINQTAALLPGVETTIAKGAELVVSSGKSIYIYDKDEWGGYCGAGDAQYMSVVVAPGRTGKRAPLADVKVDVNGKLTAIGGIYTTKSGADICSSKGTGKYVQEGNPGNETRTYQYTQKNGVTAHEIPITPAKLKNAVGGYTETSTAEAGKTIPYCACPTCGGKWTPDLKVAAIGAKEYDTLQGAVGDLKAGQYIKLLHNTTEDINITQDIYLDLNGRTVTGDITRKSGKLYGMDNTTDEYDGAKAGKIVGKINDTTIAPVFETKLKPNTEYDSLRYVAIKNEDGTEYTFHRFNISVTGYRFELKAPQCALFFIGQFQGDAEAKKYLTKLGFTLTDKIDGTSESFSHLVPDDATTDEFIYIDDSGAYFFEAYLMREIDKENPATYLTPFTASAQATFGTDSGTQNSVPKGLSFKDAWQKAENLSEEEKAILNDKFPGEPGINQQTE